MKVALSDPTCRLVGTHPHIATMPYYNLLDEPWLPWKRRDGEVEWGPPALLTDDIRNNPVVALAAPRPDFDGALQELLVGLLGVALEIPDEQAWLDLWHDPPSPDELGSEFSKFSDAFNLGGDGPRAFQALPTGDLNAVKPLPIEELLVDSKAGALFVKSGRVSRMGRPAAAMALITMQTYAPEGGRVTSPPSAAEVHLQHWLIRERTLRVSPLLTSCPSGKNCWPT